MCAAPARQRQAAGRGLARRASTTASTLALVATFLAAAPLRAAERAPSLEYAVKASLLLNFAKFAEWPAGSVQAASPSVVICVVGRDPFGNVLDGVLTGRTVGGRPAEARRPRHLEGIEACHVLFVAASETAQLARILARIGAAPVLTVGESEDFNDRGGVIRLFVEDNRARFAIDLGPTTASRLRLSSQVLKVARSVRGGSAP